ncbi:uncharacterized protein L969DRAFT_84421 [Mixia osmundae IAM 14324]|uniref:Cytochrome c oxidase assembly factor 6 n=1 Tax=Mixia osmundae (strain CBS 9802 / IAM 14324 / JCM 22182 / KY 12970) TaxID=764103 RepID=G7E2X6_MIXOS|nr:uncharacterized protein L969DRAFT_84421 [Mixia osmundae IAM 14324]KEI42555.1 hypothetical protein L969DRAFT_84421 [Mixia osmundae IAM 14324]GAA97157.1 hypothetical protein E5Q_03833 [Mixia osmundae IAM 14324]
MANAPNRSQRDRCWESRDAYFSCLDKSDVIVPGDEGKTCSKENKHYEKECAKSWVDYFNKRRVLEARQKATLAQSAINQPLPASK